MDYNGLKLPSHLGIIMDGNGRWAEERGYRRSRGHQEGAKNLKKLLSYIYDKNIPYVSLYAFSTENFKRDSQEVEYLMKLFIKMFKQEFMSFQKLGVRVLFSGRRENIPNDVWQAMKELEDMTAQEEKGVLNICLNYGGQYELVDMAKKIAEEVKAGTLLIDDITKDVVEDHLYQKLPALDFVIRTSGEMRVSNFMIYQSAYAEYYFPKTYFPDFNEKEFDQAILEYNHRKRRFGGN